MAPIYCTTARGARIAEPQIPNSPDESAGPPVCGFCGDVEVSDECETCAECLHVQRERAEDERMDNAATAGSWAVPDGED